MGKKVRRFLHVFFKIFIIMMLGILVINVLMFGAMYIYHRNKCNKEESYMHAPGRYVNVDGHQVHIARKCHRRIDRQPVARHRRPIDECSAWQIDARRLHLLIDLYDGMLTV